MNVILRTVFDKPEMLYLSIKYEQKAREYFDGDYLTLFVLDYNGHPKCADVVRNYPFKKQVIIRPHRYYVCANVMEGLKTAAPMSSEFIINMEDDVILHKTFFEYVSKAHDLVKDTKYSVITSWGYSPFGDPAILKQSDYSCGPGTVINKDFFMNYMMQFANAGYYNNWIPTIKRVNEMNKDNPKSKYKINNLSHLDWDGLMNRLVDYASFKEDLHSYSSMCFRLLHIGFYGFNRHGKYPDNIKTLNDRINFLETHIFDPDMLSKLDGTYKDYQIFDPKLDEWNGEILLDA